jgi:hypothetical protein
MWVVRVRNGVGTIASLAMSPVLQAALWGLAVIWRSAYFDAVMDSAATAGSRTRHRGARMGTWPSKLRTVDQIDHRRTRAACVQRIQRRVVGRDEARFVDEVPEHRPIG